MPKRKRTRKRRTSTAVTHSRRRGKVTRRRRSRGFLSAGKNIPFIGEMSLHNPLIGGAVGGWAGSLIKDEVQDTFFGQPKDPLNENDWMVKIQPYTKGLVLAAVAYAARRAKQPEIAAGLVGYAAGLTRSKLQEAGKIKDSGEMHRSQLARFADASLLSDTALLSDNTVMNQAGIRQLLGARRRR